LKVEVIHGVTKMLSRFYEIASRAHEIEIFFCMSLHGLRMKPQTDLSFDELTVWYNDSEIL